MSDIVERLRAHSDAFNAISNEEWMLIADGFLEDGASEISRLRADLAARDEEVARLRTGGCARDQGTTQYCAEAAKKDAEIASLLNTLADERTESMKLRAALEKINVGEGWAALIARAALEEGRT